MHFSQLEKFTGICSANRFSTLPLLSNGIAVRFFAIFLKAGKESKFLKTPIVKNMLDEMEMRVNKSF